MRAGLVFAVAALSGTACAVQTEEGTGIANSSQYSADEWKEMGKQRKLKKWMKRNKIPGHDLDDLRKLKVFDVPSHVCEQLPDDMLWSLTGLKKLSLHGMNRRSVPGKEIGNLINLEDLRLTGKLGSELLRGQIGGLLELKALNLEDTDLESLPPEIGNLKKLEVLKLSQMRRLKSLPPEMGGLAGLRKLDLFETNLELLPKEMEKLKGTIQDLDLYGCNMLRASGKSKNMLGWLELLDTFGEADMRLPSLRIETSLDGEELDSALKRWLSSGDVCRLQKLQQMAGLETAELRRKKLSSEEFEDEIEQGLLALIIRRQIGDLRKFLAFVPAAKAALDSGKFGAELEGWRTSLKDGDRRTLDESLDAAPADEEASVHRGTVDTFEGKEMFEKIRIGDPGCKLLVDEMMTTDEGKLHEKYVNLFRGRVDQCEEEPLKKLLDEMATDNIYWRMKGVAGHDKAGPTGAISDETPSPCPPDDDRWTMVLEYVLAAKVIREKIEKGQYDEELKRLETKASLWDVFCHYLSKRPEVLCRMMRTDKKFAGLVLKGNGELAHVLYRHTLNSRGAALSGMPDELVEQVIINLIVEGYFLHSGAGVVEEIVGSLGGNLPEKMDYALKAIRQKYALPENISGSTEDLRKLVEKGQLDALLGDVIEKRIRCGGVGDLPKLQKLQTKMPKERRVLEKLLDGGQLNAALKVLLVRLTERGNANGLEELSKIKALMVPLWANTLVCGGELRDALVKGIIRLNAFGPLGSMDRFLDQLLGIGNALGLRGLLDTNKLWHSSGRELRQKLKEILIEAEKHFLR